MQELTTATQFTHHGDGARIAYHFTPARDPRKPTAVMFLGGSHSHMDGAKAVALQAWCEVEGRAYLRFDYTGHGQSSGTFEDGCIGTWTADALHVLDTVSEGPQVLVGSSMGGWIALLAARERPQRVQGLVGLATAVDFTEDLMADALSAEQHVQLIANGKISVPNAYDPQTPHVITLKLIEDGKEHLVLRAPLDVRIPVRLIHGLKDADVPWETALKIQKVLLSDDVEIQFIKNAAHRLSDADDIRRLENTLDRLLQDIERT